MAKETLNPAECLYGIRLSEKVPAWWSRWRRKQLRKLGYHQDIPCMDHLKFSEEGQVIFQPYNCGMDSLKELIKICDEELWTFSIMGSSFHYPGQTLMIAIEPDPDPSKRCIICGRRATNVKVRPHAEVLTLDPICEKH